MLVVFLGEIRVSYTDVRPEGLLTTMVRVCFLRKSEWISGRKTSESECVDGRRGSESEEV
jgi:hypothetical protein